MAKLYAECPFCHAHLETDGANEGRQGQCPHCENVFEIRPAGRKGRSDAGVPAEYTDKAVVVMALTAALFLIVLAASSLLSWSASLDPTREAFLAGQKTTIGGVSLVCSAFVIVSLLGRKSMVPSVLVSGAWGLAAVIWIVGLLVALKGGQDSPGAVQSGLYLGLVTACVLLVLGAYLLLQFRGGDIFAGIGVFSAAVYLAALVAGALAVALTVRPALCGEAAEGRGEETRRNDDGRRPGANDGRARPGRNQGQHERGTASAALVRPKGEHIWVEGEDAAETDYTRHEWFDNVNRNLLSGQNWLSHYNTRQQGTATWRFDVPKAGRYTFWLRCVADARQQYSLNGGPRLAINATRAAGKRVNIAPGGAADGRFLAWINVGGVPLNQGQNTLTITQAGEIANSGGVDCFCFTDSDWKPGGAK